MTAHTLLLLLLASNVLGHPDSEGRLERLLEHYVPQHRQRHCSLGTCQMSRLPKIVYWLSFASTKELSGKAGHEPQDPHSHGRRRRRRRREALVLCVVSGTLACGKEAIAGPSSLGDIWHVSGPPLASVTHLYIRATTASFFFPDSMWAHPEIASSPPPQLRL